LLLLLFSAWDVGDMRVSLTPKAMAGALLAAGLCLGFGGCGVRGSLDPPPSATATGNAKSAEASGTQPESAAPPKPHDGFVLDPLLR
jgi:hypothetical protein